jgi:hypothetical protein
MTFRAKICAALAAALFASPAAAWPPPASPAPSVTIPAQSGSRLQPEDAGFADYRSSERRVFDAAFAPGVVARMIGEPSFEREYAVGLASDGGKYRIFVLEPSAQIWSYTILKMMKDGSITSTDGNGRSTTADQIRQLEAALPPHPEDLKLARCDVEVRPELAVRIVESWRHMLATTEPTHALGLDGAFYHFAVRDGGSERRGQTWSPDAASNAGRLVAIAIAMRDACKTRSNAALSAIPGLADAIGQTP